MADRGILCISTDMLNSSVAEEVVDLIRFQVPASSHVVPRGQLGSDAGEPDVQGVRHAAAVSQVTDSAALGPRIREPGIAQHSAVVSRRDQMKIQGFSDKVIDCIEKLTEFMEYVFEEPRVSLRTL